MLLDGVHEAFEGRVIEAPLAPFRRCAVTRREDELACHRAYGLQPIPIGGEYLSREKEVNGVSISNRGDLNADTMIRVLRILPGKLLEDHPGSPRIKCFRCEATRREQREERREQRR